MALVVDFPHQRAFSHTQGGVSFSDQTHVRLVKNLSYKHQSELWYSEDDIQSFKRRTALIIHGIKTVMTMSQYAEINAHDTSAFLGLDGYLDESGFQGTKRRRRAIRSAVLWEQKRQLSLGIHDPDEMAHISEEITHLSRMRAFIIGLIHAEKFERQMVL